MGTFLAGEPQTFTENHALLPPKILSLARSLQSGARCGVSFVNLLCSDSFRAALVGTLFLCYSRRLDGGLAPACFTPLCRLCMLACAVVAAPSEVSGSGAACHEHALSICTLD